MHFFDVSAFDGGVHRVMRARPGLVPNVTCKICVRMLSMRSFKFPFATLLSMTTIVVAQDVVTPLPDWPAS